MSCLRSYRGLGRICWPRRPAARSTRARIPAAWREYAFRRTGREAPQIMTDGTEPEFARFESGYDLADRVDQAIMATEGLYFPSTG